MGRYTARIAARRIDRLRLKAIGVFQIEIDYSVLFVDDEQVMNEERIEQAYVEAETAGKIGTTAAEAIAYLGGLGIIDQSD